MTPGDAVSGTQVNLGNVLDTTPTHGVLHEMLDRLGDRVVATHDRIGCGRATGEHGYESLNLPNTAGPATIRDAVSQLDNPSAVATIGIDGSALGVAALADMLESDVDTYYLDNVDPGAVERPLDSLDLASTVVNVVS